MKQLEKTIKGHKYSTSQFDGYKFRAKGTIKHYGIEHDLDVYTTNPDKSDVEILILRAMRKKYKDADFRMFYWTSAEQDGITDKFINEIFNDWE